MFESNKYLFGHISKIKYVWFKQRFSSALKKVFNSVLIFYYYMYTYILRIEILNSTVFGIQEHVIIFYLCIYKCQTSFTYSVLKFRFDTIACKVNMWVWVLSTYRRVALHYDEALEISLKAVLDLLHRLPSKISWDMREKSF